MNLSIMKKMNDKPLRRVQGFKFNLATKIDILDSSIQPPQLTFMFWCVFNSDVSQTRQVILNKLLDKTVLDINRFTLFSSVSSGASYYGIQLFNSSSENILSDGEFVNDGLHHISFSLDVTTNMYSGCVDGVEVFSGTYVGVYTYDAADWILGIGDHYFNNSKNMISDVKIYDYILTASEIKEEMKGNVLPALGYWPLQYNTKDYSGNGNNGIVKGAEQYEIVERGIKSINDAEVLSKRGFNADGITYITLANSLQNLTISDFTIMFICKLVKDADDPWNTIFATQNNDNNAGYSIRVLAYDGGPNYLNFSDEFSDGEQQIIAEIPNTIDIENTLHISFQYESTNVLNSKWKIDGIDIPNTITNVRTGTRITSVDTWVGKIISLAGDRDFLNGELSSLKIFDSYLTEAQIKEEMRGNILPALGYWPLQEDTKDYSNNSNNGTVTGTEQYETVQNGLTDWKDPVLP